MSEQLDSIRKLYAQFAARHAALRKRLGRSLTMA